MNKMTYDFSDRMAVTAARNESKSRVCGVGEMGGVSLLSGEV